VVGKISIMIYVASYGEICGTNFRDLDNDFLTNSIGTACIIFVEKIPAKSMKFASHKNFLPYGMPF